MNISKYLLAACLLAPFAVSGRHADDERPLLTLADPGGWSVTATNAEAALAVNTACLLFDSGVSEFRYRATGPDPVVFLRPPAPFPASGPFDTVTLWVYGRFMPWDRRPGDDPVTIQALFKDPSGKERSVDLGKANHPEWFLKRRKLGTEEARPFASGGTFTGFRITGFSNAERRDVLLASLCAFKDARRHVSLPPRPRRGFSLFPDASQGLNVGVGKLPFPTTPLTVIPPVDRLAPLEVRYPSLAGNWDSLAVRWDGGAWITPAVGGGIYFDDGQGRPVRATDERMQLRQTQNGVAFSGTFCLEGREIGSGEVIFHREGQSVAVDLHVKGGHVMQVSFGRWPDAKNAEIIPVPYYTYCLDYELMHRPCVVRADVGGAPLFFAAGFDWTQTAGSYPDVRCDEGAGVAPNGMMQYRPLYGGEGRRADCVERFVYSFSRDFARVLPNIPNPKSPYRELIGDYVRAVHNSTIRDRDRRQMRALRRRGMKDLLVTDHETMWRDGYESFTYRVDAAPKKGGDAAQRDYTRFMIDELGFRYGPYNNWMDFAPVSGYWDPEMISLDPQGQFKAAWTRCYQPKPAFMPYMCGKLAPQIQSKFGFNCAYCDVHTTFSPWIRVDYDARLPDAGSAYSPFYASGEVMLLQKKTWGGPVFSEGGVHFLWAGLTDGNYAQDGTYLLCRNPWIVDFDLLRIHPLECDSGVGEHHFWGGRAKEPADKSFAQDMALTATAAFGHQPQLSDTRNAAFQLRSYYMLHSLARRYVKANASKIGYVDENGKIELTNEALASGSYRRNQVVVEYDDGTWVAANGNVNGALMRIEEDGRRIELPPAGYFGRSGDGKVTVFAGLQKGHRADCVNSDEYVYVAGRGEWASFPCGSTDGELLRLFEPGGTEEVFLAGGATAAELPYVASRVVGLDEAGHETGPIAFSVKGNVTRLNAFAKGIVSCRVTR